MKIALLILIGSQLLFSLGDVLARHYMVTLGFKLTTFISGWFLLYISLRTVATFGQLYVFSQFELGRAMTLFGVVGLVLANVLGILVLKEELPLQVYFGVVLAIIAFFVVGLARQ